MSGHRILILGGTTEARLLAGRLATDGADVTLSLAGRTADPVAHPVPVRVGGFGGTEGLARFMEEQRIDLLIDATHPYAVLISRNAAGAARLSETPILALRRPAWEPVAGDRWTAVETVEAAVEALGTAPRRVFLTIGRQELAPFTAAPQHAYLIRSVDPVEPPLAVPDAAYLTARGPFVEEDERALLEGHRIDALVSKNSGGPAAYGKLAAARALGIEVVLVARPAPPEVPAAATVDEAAALAGHALSSFRKRGV